MARLVALLLLLAVPGLSHARGLSFDEEMHGNAYYAGEFRLADVYFHAVIGDIDAWVADPEYAAVLSGSLYMDPLQPQQVSGSLQVLAAAPGGEGRVLVYRFANGRQQFVGVKHVYDDIGFDLIDMTDDMTTLHGRFALPGAPAPTVDDLLYHGTWTSELHFEWWKPATVAAFVGSFTALDTPPNQQWQVKMLFLGTVLGDLIPIYYPGLPLH